MPCRATGKLLTFEYYDVSHAAFGQMVGDGATFDAAADDDDFSTFGEIYVSHAVIPIK